MIPTLIQIIDSSVVNVALNHIQGNLSTNRETVTWVITVYLVANAVIIPLSAWLARVMGRKRYLLISIAIFTGSSLLCGTATGLSQLVFFRIIQGLGGGGLQPMSTAILLETFPPRERGVAMSIFGMGVVVGPIIGPLLGGYLTDNLSWRWAFYINLPIGILAFFMILSFVFDPPYQQRRSRGEKTDYLGIILLCLGLGCVQIVMDRGQQNDWFNSDVILLLFAISMVSLVVFIFWEILHDQPVLDLSIFKDISFAAGNAVMFLGFFAFFGSIVLLPLYLQGLMGYNAFLSGIVLGPGGAAALITMPIIGKLTQRIDARMILGVGLVFCAYAVYIMSGFNLHIDMGTVIHARVIQGFAMSLFFVPLSYITMAWVSNEQMNKASAIYNLVRNMGGSLGVAFVSTVVARRTQFHQNRLIEHMTSLDSEFSIHLEELKQFLALRLGSFVDLDLFARWFIYRRLQREAAGFAFNDAFYIQALLILGLVLIIWIMRKPPVEGRAAPGGE